MSVRTLSAQTVSGRRWNASNAEMYGRGSVLFDSTENLTINNNDAFKFLTADFTVEYWIYRTSSANSAVLGVEYDGSQYWGFFHNYNNGAGGIDFYVSDSNNIQAAGGTVPLNTWTHVAGTRSSGTRRLFVNGVEQGSRSNTLSINPAGKLYIGRDPVLGRQFAGYLSNIRIVKGNALYTANFTPPTSPLKVIDGTTLLTCNKPNQIVDVSANNLTITTASGTPTASAFNPFD